MKYQSFQEFGTYIAERNPGQPEYLQAVVEVMESLWPFITSHPRYAEHGLLDRLIEPERIVMFRVSWVDDHGEVKVNRGYRIQHSSSIGPYKGGTRFHPSVNLSILKFLAFEQTLKNSLTTLPMGGGKGGADFDPKGRSPGEVMRFCQTYMTELFRHIGSDTDVPAGDIGVGGREVGFMAGMMKKLSNRSDAVFTGKGLSFGGSLIRPEATGYGTVYFAEEMLKHTGRSFDGLRVSVSGSGNVAQYAVEKAMSLGAKVVTVSDSSGTVVDEQGFTPEKLAILMEVKNHLRGRVNDYAERVKVSFVAGARPWHVPVDVALPCATQNELDEKDASTLIKNGVICVAEGPSDAGLGFGVGMHCAVSVNKAQLLHRQHNGPLHRVQDMRTRANNFCSPVALRGRVEITSQQQWHAGSNQRAPVRQVILQPCHARVHFIGQHFCQRAAIAHQLWAIWVGRQMDV